MRGQALEYRGNLSRPPELESAEQGDTLINWDEQGYLQVAAGLIIEQGRQNESYYAWVKYDRAQLNLDKFYRYQAGTISPPSRCRVQ